MSFWLIMVLCFCYGFVPARKHKAAEKAVA
jgi:hypothetical protein